MNVNNQEYMEDARGALIPMSCVKEIDILRHNTVMDIVKKSQEIKVVLDRFKQDTMGDVAAFVQLSAEKYGVRFGGEKGNVSLVSFDGQYKIVRAMNDYIIFDERLQVAKQLIDDCIKRWSGDGINDYLRVIVNDAFQVDKTGKISTGRILGLRRHDIKDELWLKAMEAISDAITITGSKAYLRIYKKCAEDKYEQINLDITSI